MMRSIKQYLPLVSSLAPPLFLLAAGASSRFGGCKQIKKLKDGTPLIEKLIAEAKKAGFENIHVITGHYHSQILPHCDGCTVHFNQNWKNGMGASIAFAATIYSREKHAGPFVFSMTDQPFLNASIFTQLLHALPLRQKEVLLCKYTETLKGPPVAFPPYFLPYLKMLNQDSGAQSVVQQHAEKCKTIFFAKGEIEFDHPHNYDAYLEHP